MMNVSSIKGGGNSTLKPPHNKKKSKGFTLVELIVVVVILAIVVGVVIGGLSSYVKKSRINTDINNASAIKKVISTLSTDKEVVQAFKDLPNDSLIGIEWKDKQSISEGQFKSEGTPARVDESIPPIFINKIGELLPEGLPESKSGETFYITMSKDSTTGELMFNTFSTVTSDENTGEGSESGAGGSSSNKVPDIVVSHEHTYNSTITQEPTCTEKGLKTYKCTQCAKTYTEDIEPSGHNSTNGGVASIHSKCSVCGVTLGGADQHTYTVKVETQATCVNKGTTKYECSCGYNYTEQNIPATGVHNYVSGKCTVCQKALEYGLYDDNYKLLKTWSQLISEGTIKVSGGVLTTNYNSTTSINESSDKLNGHLVISNTVTSLGERAFMDCKNLKSAVLPSSITTFGNYVFYGDEKLQSVSIPNSVTSMGEWTFWCCYDLKSVNIPNKLTTLPLGTFHGCQSLKSIDIPSSVQVIGDGAFNWCSSLESIVIPSGVTKITTGTFRYCEKLASVTIPNSVTEISTNAFYNCTSLKSITLPNSLKTINRGAFSDCTGLASVVIPNSVTTIGEYAFENVQHIYYNGTATGAPWGASAIN